MNTLKSARGFTLVEIAIVLLIIGVLARTLLQPLTHNQRHKRVEQTHAELQIIKDSLHAHVVSHGHLPCPIAGGSGGSGSLPSTSAGPTKCTTKRGGIPAILLGLAGPINAHGSLLDPWNNPYEYAVSLSNHPSRGDQSLPDWTSPGEASLVGIRHLSSELMLCLEPGSGACSRQKTRANHLVFIVFSQGEDVSSNGAQKENMDKDGIFVANNWLVDVNAPFDDQIVWSSQQDVMYWMLRAAWLP